AITIMSDVFNIKFKTHKFKYRKNMRFFRQYAEDQLQNKIKGYRSFLLSIVSYNKHTPCVSDDDISKYITLVESLNAHIK
ncbi:hypothetical protein, partial [Aeromonas media]|uniref:hypothetical protein n=1 Tax=Aeromonas media TaxID=651 RepID=UPI003CFC59F1